LWDKPASLIKCTAVGYTLCNRRVERAQMTRFPDDASCAACLARVAQKENPGGQTGVSDLVIHTPGKERA
jgi:hypothetical protein